MKKKCFCGEPVYPGSKYCPPHRDVYIDKEGTARTMGRNGKLTGRFRIFTRRRPGSKIKMVDI